MKPFRLLLCVLIICQGLTPPAFAQEPLNIFVIPDAQVSSLYRVSIEKVLKDKYGLRLEAGQSAAVFRWTLADGELPPGLTLRPNGTIIGTPRAARPEPYVLQVNVVQAATPGAGPLRLAISLSVAAPQIRLVQVKRPQLVPVGPAAGESAHANGHEATNSAADTTPLFARGNALTWQPERGNAYGATEVARADVARAIPAVVRTSAVEERGSARGATAASASTLRRQISPTPPCNISGLPAPSAAPGPGVIYIDARNGGMTENGRPVTSGRRFKKGERVRVVVDNKNPYLYTYRLTATATPVVESALSTFVPFIVGDLGDLGTAAPAPAPPGFVARSVDNRTEDEKRRVAAACQAAEVATTRLEGLVNRAVSDKNTIRTDVNDQKGKARALTDDYNRARIPLYAANQTRADLHRASNNLISAVHARVGSPSGVDQAALDKAGNDIADLRRRATRLKAEVVAIRAANPDCLAQIEPKLRWAEGALDEIEAQLGAFETVLGQIQQNLNQALEGRDAVLRVLCDPRAFFDEHTIGGFETTNEVTVQLSVTPRQGVTEAVAVAGAPFESKFTFGGGPFFSISGGLIFSPLRKREFVRVQGFERDRAGNLVLDENGAPKLATVIGLEESSPTRISPAIFLNGRLKEFNNRIIDGLHLSLGITAKNDNEGTDVEFLLGPSLSMLERNMFFTFGGYAGRQQKLAGGLFEGFALPEGVDEIPIEKNYRWNIGFSLSYRLPVND